MKVLKYTVSALALTFLLNSPVKAQGEGGLGAEILEAIREDTHAILEKVNKLPDYIQIITAMALSWTDTNDESKSIAVNGSLFSMLATARNLDLKEQIDLTKNATLTFLGKNNKIPNVNDYAYTTLLNAPPVTPNKLTGPLESSADNYIKNVSGTSLPMTAPSPEWRTQGQDRQDYYHLYTTLAAVQSYNSYVLNKVYAERQQRMQYPSGIPNRKKGDAASTQDILTTMVESASSTDWYTRVGSESIGLVLRQLLMFTSQNFILLKKMLDTQQDMLLSQAMTNTLMMQNAGLGQGRLLYKQASGTLGQ